MDGPTPAPLRLAGLRKRWPSTGATVLEAIDLRLDPGQLGVVEGANGSGKTTLLRIVAGVLHADDGAVEVCGTTIDDDREAYQRQIGIVTAGNSGLYNRLNCVQHLRFGAAIALIDRRRRTGLARQALERFGLEGFANRRVDRLSMGQRQRLRLALAFLHEPAVVLLDEPTTSLDAAGIELLDRAVLEHLDAGRSALWLTPTGVPPSLSPSVARTLVAGVLHPA